MSSTPQNADPFDAPSFTATRAVDPLTGEQLLAETSISTDEPILEENWLEKRRRYIGGSDSASMFADPRLPAFGKDGIKYGCARRLVYLKRGTAPDFKRTQEEEENFSRGHELEPVAAEKFLRENGLGLKLRKAPAHRMSRTHERAGVNMDYEIVGVTPEQLFALFERSDVTGPGYLECKSANEYVFEDVEKHKGANIDYVFQMQHGLAVKRWNWGIFNVLGYGPGLWRLAHFPMLANKELGARILERTDEIWAMVEDRAPIPPALPQPDPEDRCTNCQFRKQCLADSFVAPIGDGVVQVREDLQDAMVTYRMAKEASEAADKIKEAAAKELITQIAKGGKFKSLPLVLPREDSDGKAVELVGTHVYRLEERVDVKALKAEQPEIAAKYLRPLVKDYIEIRVRGQKGD